ncbi:MAG: pyrroline-5-carboxylate reductase [Anaerolineae bacterium]|nr:pyrroline-5-carboxylate reductase [Anaerolineae bacterium]
MLPTIAIIGAGTMGEALLKGLLRQGVISPQAIIASEPRLERLEALTQHYGIRGTQENASAVREADIVFLSVKPQVMTRVLEDIKNPIRPETLVFTIAAGVRIATIQNALGTNNVVRAMPNTPAQIGAGITVWTATPDVTEVQRQHTLTILHCLGEEVYVDDEHYLDMATALSGTGPAYIYLFMEAMIDAGVHLGFSRWIAEKLVTQTVIGSALYAQQSELHPAALRNQVTSPGGTTAEALYHLEKGGFRTVLSRAIWAAYVRANQLGKNTD